VGTVKGTIANAAKMIPSRPTAIAKSTPHRAARCPNNAITSPDEWKEWSPDFAGRQCQSINRRSRARSFVCQRFAFERMRVAVLVMPDEHS